LTRLKKKEKAETLDGESRPGTESETLKRTVLPNYQFLTCLEIVGMFHRTRGMSNLGE
jgi:hypothetical protein